MTHPPIVVVADRNATLGEILPRLGDGAESALHEGRVFIASRRASNASDAVVAGDEVTMYAARTRGAEAPRILARHGGIVAAYKPADIATVADHRGSAGTLEREVAALLELSSEKLFVTSRLDVGVSGVVLFATDERSRAELSRARDEGRYVRHYVAVAVRSPLPERGVWNAPVGRDRDPRKRRAHGRDAVPACTRYAVAAVTERAALLAVEPETGRTHQIRVHASHAGSPLYGDAAYGGPARMVSSTGSVTSIARIALHAAWVEVPAEHGATFRAEAEIPEDFEAIWAACGGVRSALGPAWEPLSHE